MEGSGCGLIKILSWHVPERTEKNPEKQPGQQISRLIFQMGLPEYETVLLTTQL
jgi:hypothetical protein